MLNNRMSFVNMASCCCRSRVSQVLNMAGCFGVHCFASAMTLN